MLESRLQHVMRCMKIDATKKVNQIFLKITVPKLSQERIRKICSRVRRITYLRPVIVQLPGALRMARTIHLFKYPAYVRTTIYTTFAVQIVHRQFHKLTKTKGDVSPPRIAYSSCSTPVYSRRPSTGRTQCRSGISACRNSPSMLRAGRMSISRYDDWLPQRFEHPTR